MTVVVDASAVVAALTDKGKTGEWAAAALLGKDLVAPHLMQVEAANILRRAALAGEISNEVSSQAFADLLDLRVALLPFTLVAERVWQLRNTVTAYDAAYVALAEMLEVSLVTCDARLARAPGTTCSFIVPS